MFWGFLGHIGTLLDHLGGISTHMGGALPPKKQAKLSKYMGDGEVNISASIRAPCTKFFWTFLRHIGTLLDHLEGVSTPMDRASAPEKWAKLSKYMGDGEVNISASIRAPCTKFFLDIPETHRNTFRPLGRC